MTFFIQKGRIGSICITPGNDEENRRDATINVTSKELFKSNRPVPGGIYDAHMGTTDFAWPCTTCHNHKGICPGHPGVFELKYPVKNPQFREHLLKWLKIVCFACGNLLVKNIPKANPTKILSEIAKSLSNESVACPCCGTMSSKVSVDATTPLRFYSTKEYERELMNFEIKEIVEKVTSRTMMSLGISPTSHPRYFINSTLRCLPNTARPEIKNPGAGKSNSNDVTVVMKQIIEQSDSILPIESVDTMSAEEVAKCNKLDALNNSLIRGSAAGSEGSQLTAGNMKIIPSISQKFSGKAGLFRRILLGKRIFHIARAVITTDPTLQVYEIGVPIKIAKKLQVPEVVNKHNLTRLQVFLQNGKNAYPGIESIKMHKITTSVENIPADYKLKIGDVVNRDLIDGDQVLFNRQPSLSFASIGSHVVKIVKEGLCIRMNVSACKVYNADFDGDQMHMIICQNIQSREEIFKLSNVKNWMVSYQHGAPMYGNYFDSLIGTAILTREGVKIGKLAMMDLCANILPKDKAIKFDQAGYTGREAFSLILPDINYPDRTPSFYMSQFVQYVKYNPADIKVRINRGKLISGVIDKSSAGEEERGSIYHVINNEYGAQVALDTIYNCNRMAIAFLGYRGFTTGYKDMLIGPEAHERIREKIARTIQDSKAITAKLNNKTLIPPRGVPLNEFYEMEQLSALDPDDGIIEPVLSSMDIYNNGLAELIFHKSKGKTVNFIAINTAIGSQIVGEKRPPKTLSGRTCPYYQRNEDNPIASGYVTDSWYTGIRPESYVFSCAESKHGLINNALVTCVSGAQMRVSMKNVDSSITDNSRKTMKDRNVIQFLYADNGVNTNKYARVTIPTIKISGEDLKKYRMKSSDFKGFDNAEVQKVLDEEYKTIVEDRDMYRTMFFEIERSTQRYIFDNQVKSPIDPYMVIDDIIYRHKEMVGKSLNPLTAVKKVRQLCQDLGYTYMNENCRKMKVEVTECIRYALTTTYIVVRAYLCTYNLKRNGISDELLDILIQKLYSSYRMSLIDAGFAVGVLAAHCICEPFTQFVLNSKHRSGGGSRSSVSQLTRMTELFSATKTANLKMPMMLIMVKEEYETDKERIQEIASYIKMLEFGQFITVEHIFEESFAEPVHPDFIEDKQWMLKSFKYGNIPTKRPTFVKWCVRYEISREELYINNLRFDKLIYEIQAKNPDIAVLHTTEFSSTIVIRVYFNAQMFKTIGESTRSVRTKSNDLKKTLIRGISNITNTEIVEIPKSYVEADGSIKNKKIFAISAMGTNMRDMLKNPYIDPYRTQTNSIIEFEEVYGIEAARDKLISEWLSISEKAQYSHYTLFADEMTFSGYVTGIQRSGLSIRERENVALRLAFQAPLEVLRSSALAAITSTLNGISGQFIFGQLPRVGTTYNDVVIDTDFVERHRKKMVQDIEENI